MLLVIILLNLSLGLSLPSCKIVPVSANSLFNVSEFENLCLRIVSFSKWDLLYIFSNVKMNISSVDQPNVLSVYRLRGSSSNETAGWFLYSLFGKEKFTRVQNTSFSLNPYENCAVMVENGFGDNRIRVETKFSPIDYLQVLFFVTFFGVLYYSRSIVTCPLFYYAIGLVMGIFLSSLFLAYLLYVFYAKTGIVPGFVAKFVYLTIGIAFSFYLKHIWFFVYSYPNAFMTYMGVTSFISLATVYYFGPIKDAKVINILVLSLRILSLMAICIFSNNLVVTFTWIGGFFILLVFRRANFRRILKIFCRKPTVVSKPREFITIKEYEELGKSYTECALDELREQLAGEGSSVRKLAKLKDPMRVFAFASGGDHLTDEEIAYQSDVLNESYFSDDKEDINNRPFYDNEDAK